ncbi:hypothetical protein A9Q87_08840 [Flavobacteriales bacterium 34_180_T64]|nr:hypothetical protein A9Q87_08840 [Flavobacteriales bacterium 34_180_T64]
MKKSIKLFVMFLAAMAFGQDHSVEGEINSVNEDGLYRIHIPHNIRSYATTDLHDLRIWDAKGNQVPYFLQPATAYKRTNDSEFTEFPVVSRTIIADTSATYIFKNPYETIEQAVFLIANYQGSKSYRLEGSNDQKQWFGIVNSGQLNELNHSTQTSVYKLIDFPLCSYQYLKVVFDDRHSLPINLIKIGEATSEIVTIVPITMEKIPVKAIEFLEKDQKTQLHIRFERPEVINQIRMDITDPDLYSRNATLFTIKERVVKHKMESYRQHLTTFSLRSNKDLVFEIPTCVEKEVYLEIDNKDNPKLEISGIHFMQEPKYLVASLRSQETYKVTAGNKTLNIPDYDISEVTNTSKTALPIAQIISIANVQPKKVIKESTSFWQQTWFMWCCIGFAALIISYFAFNLIKELNNKKES